MPSTARARLTCQSCARRKVKCDKGSPCGNCVRNNIPCIAVERRRLPRGRTRRPKAEHAQNLSDRLRKLEDTLEAAGISTTVPTTNTQCRGDLTERNQHSPVTGNPQSSEGRERSTLLGVFFHQVDPIVKILHRPSLSAYICQEGRYLNYERDDPAPAALTAAVLYISSATLSREQCITLLGEQKDTVVARYQEQTQAALARADFVVTNDITVLQAFVLSLVAVRTHDRSRRMWTMLSVALRIAQALSLHLPESSFPLRPFEREMRHRLWHLIAWLDVEATLDRASEPLTRSMWVQQHHITNINDGDYGFGQHELVPLPSLNPGNRVTDVTLFIMLSHAQRALRTLDLSARTEPGATNILARQQMVDDFRCSANTLLAGCEPGNVPFHWFITQLKECIHAVLQLVALRPLETSAATFSTSIPRSQVLVMAADILKERQRIYSDHRAEPWRWLEPFFFPRHALAVALAEVCACAGTERSLADADWRTLEKHYDLFLEQTVDMDQERLWRSMQDLMQNARTVHDSLRRGVTIGSGSRSWSDEGLEMSQSASSTDLLAPTWQANYLHVPAWDQYGQIIEHLGGTGNFDFPILESSYFS
ncbi:hypothetical protein BJX99DRAFT_238163 [Aspergillus californicus]